MAELTISSDEIRGALERYVSSYTPEISREEVGVVTEAGDGIAHVEGLPSAMANELLEFEDGTLGVALNLDVREIGVVVLGDVRAASRRASRSSAPAGCSRSRSATPSSAASLTRSASRSTASARSSQRGLPRARAAGAERHGAPAGQGGAADRHQGDRRDDRHRPGPAPADHR